MGANRNQAELERIVFFDGVCNLCNHSVQFLLRNDKKGRLKYASLQSDAAAHLLQPFAVEEGYMNSILFLDKGQIYFESDAVLHICRYIRSPWKYLYYFRFIPKGIRNPIYRLIARNRYKWFGKKDVCMIPDVNVSDRFLEQWPV